MSEAEEQMFKQNLESIGKVGSKYTTDEFAGNVKVTTSEKEVRVWVCDERGCQFRFKAMGKVVKSGGMDVMVVAENNSHDALLKACNSCLNIIVNGIMDDKKVVDAIIEARAAIKQVGK